MARSTRRCGRSFRQTKKRVGYEEFLSEATGLSSADIYAINEIQSDEANHMLILQAMLRRYDGDVAAAPDGAAKALREIGDGIKIDSG